MYRSSPVCVVMRTLVCCSAGGLAVVWVLGLVWAISNEVGLAGAAAQDVAHLATGPTDVGISLWGEGNAGGGQ